jgi:hypothetical protein
MLPVTPLFRTVQDFGLVAAGTLGDTCVPALREGVTLAHLTVAGKPQIIPRSLFEFLVGGPRQQALEFVPAGQELFRHEDQCTAASLIPKR